MSRVSKPNSILEQKRRSAAGSASCTQITHPRCISVACRINMDAASERMRMRGQLRCRIWACECGMEEYARGQTGEWVGGAAWLGAVGLNVFPISISKMLKVRGKSI